MKYQHQHGFADQINSKRKTKAVKVRYFKKASQVNAHGIAPNKNYSLPTNVNQKWCKMDNIRFINGNAIIYTRSTDKLMIISINFDKYFTNN